MSPATFSCAANFSLLESKINGDYLSSIKLRVNRLPLAHRKTDLLEFTPSEIAHIFVVNIHNNPRAVARIGLIKTCDRSYGYIFTVLFRDDWETLIDLGFSTGHWDDEDGDNSAEMVANCKTNVEFYNQQFDKLCRNEGQTIEDVERERMEDQGGMGMRVFIAQANALNDSGDRPGREGFAPVY